MTQEELELKVKDLESRLRGLEARAGYIPPPYYYVPNTWNLGLSSDIPPHFNSDGSTIK